jgi:serine/threonine-protein kinase HipA
MRSKQVEKNTYGVWLKDRRVGTLNQRGDYTWFALEDDYIADSDREILGLTFEDDPHAVHSSALRLPPWFSNLLPEGYLRKMIARQRGVSAQREMELLAQVGRDLPGAVRVLAEGNVPAADGTPATKALPTPTRASLFPETGQIWRFSLAGIVPKFSMLQKNDRLVFPAFGEGGDWIVKLPSPQYARVPENENAMMTLAEFSGISVPEHKLVSRQNLDGLPRDSWKSSEEFAYAVRRFDRTTGDRQLVHMEDLAQVRNVGGRDEGKYRGNFETVAALIYRHKHVDDLQEFARRITFNVLISNGDTHLKNWSLLYENPRIPRLSPAYDLVSTSFYSDPPSQDDLGLKFEKSRRFENFRFAGLARLQHKLGATGADLPAVAEELTRQMLRHWPVVAGMLDTAPDLRDHLGTCIENRARQILRG